MSLRDGFPRVPVAKRDLHPWQHSGVPFGTRRRKAKTPSLAPKRANLRWHVRNVNGMSVPPAERGGRRGTVEWVPEREGSSDRIADPIESGMTTESTSCSIPVLIWETVR